MSSSSGSYSECSESICQDKLVAMLQAFQDIGHRPRPDGSIANFQNSDRTLTSAPVNFIVSAGFQRNHLMFLRPCVCFRRTVEHEVLITGPLASLVMPRSSKEEFCVRGFLSSILAKIIWQQGISIAHYSSIVLLAEKHYSSLSNWKFWIKYNITTRVASSRLIQSSR